MKPTSYTMGGHSLEVSLLMKSHGPQGPQSRILPEREEWAILVNLQLQFPPVFP